MSVSREAIVEFWLRARSAMRGTRSVREDAAQELPLRSELFSADQMERHGRALARSHKVSTGRAADLLLARLSANQRLLAQACDLLTRAVSANRRVNAGTLRKWLLDNYLSLDRGADPHRQAASAEELQSRTATARREAILRPGFSARLGLP